ncbi:MAG: hypothetical protein CL840_11965, partial [Crocinitomicaceae bacterium]|nr:hypothetical protein [Crocinitomicaceae bacterium]
MRYTFFNIILLSFLSIFFLQINGQSCNSPISVYCFNGDSKDNSGSNNHSISNNATLTTGRLGYLNTAYKFNGLNQKIQLPTSPFYGHNEYTYAAWVKVNKNPAIGQAQCIFHVGGAGPDQSILLTNAYAPAKHTGFGAASYDSSTAGSGVSFTNSLPKVNQWYHVAVTRSNTVLKLYIDGVLNKSVSLNNSSAKYSTSPMLVELGARASTSGTIQYFNGVIDELVVYSCILDSVKIKALYNSKSCDSVRQSCVTSPLSVHCFNGNAKDGTSNGNNGTVSGASLTTNRKGRSKAAYSFDGINDNIAVSGSKYTGKNEFTYSAWVNVSQNPGINKYYMLLSVGGSGGDQHIALGNRSSFNHVGFGIGTYNTSGFENVYTNTLPTVNQWYHIAFTRTNKVAKLYVNGVLSDTVKINNRNANYGSNSAMKIGSRFNNTQHFKGKIDDVRIYGCAMNSTEIVSLYNSNSCDSCNAPVMKYCFNGNANDESGNGNNVTSNTASLDSNRYGKPNSAYSFNGTTASMSAPVAPLKGHDQYTYSAWVYPTQNPGAGSGRVILSVGATPTDQMMGIFNNVSAGHVGWCISTYNTSGSPSNVCTGSLPVLNKWYHISFTRTNKGAKLYLDGVLKDTVALSNVSAGYASSPVAKIGARYNNTQKWKGKIDDVNLFNCELNAGEIMNLYKSKDCEDTCKSYSVPISFVGFDTTYCSNGSNDTLSALPEGGTFSGVGMTDSVFTAAGRTAGNYNIIYRFLDSNYCEWIDTVVATVVDPSSASAGTYSNQCLNSGLLTLSGTPSGGVFSGVGVNSNKFNPVSAGVGTHSIYYDANDSNGCSVLDTITLRVDSAPKVSFSSLSPVCHQSGKLILSGGNPFGGMYSGNGVKNGKFDPDSSGIGSHVITYTYTDTNSCTGTDTSKIIVSKNPTASVSQVPDQCVSTFWINLSSYGSHTGGTFYGPTVFSNRFYPTIIGKGTHTLHYKVDSLGCSDTASFTIKVDSNLTASLSSYPAICINAPAFPLYGGSPTGGTYLVNGSVATSANPGTLGVGIHEIRYYATNACGSDTATISLVINAKPTVGLSSFSAVCSNSGLLTLSGGSPSGGTYFGNNTSSGSFNPSTAGGGSHTINYTYTDGKGCKDTASQTIVVNSSPTVTFSSLSDVCIDNGLVTLSGGSPTGGIYSGTGVSSNNFNPATAGVGTHNIVYSYTDGNGCTNKDSTNQVVNAQPMVSLSSFSAICSNSGLLTLTGGSPSGGTYFGNNVSSGKFNPLTAGAGTHTINYTYTDGNSCSDTASNTIVVNASPTVTFSSLSDVCIDNGLVTLSGGSPTPGTYSGTGVSGTTFNPVTAGVGTHTITYKHTDA